MGQAAVDWPIGMRAELVDYLPPTVVWRTGCSARVDEDLWSSVADPVADRLRDGGLHRARRDGGRERRGPG